jgi:hypothetical protein
MAECGPIDKAFEQAFNNPTVFNGIGRPCFLSFVTTFATIATVGDVSSALLSNVSTLCLLNDRPDPHNARKSLPRLDTPNSSTQYGSGLNVSISMCL